MIFHLPTHTHAHTHARTHAHTHTHNRLTALCPGLPGWASTRRNIHPLTSILIIRHPINFLHPFTLTLKSVLEVIFIFIYDTEILTILHYYDLQQPPCSISISVLISLSYSIRQSVALVLCDACTQWAKNTNFQYTIHMQQFQKIWMFRKWSQN